MAYMVELAVFCDRKCGRRAVVEVKNHMNASQGRYCRRCGDKVLAETNRSEQAMRAPR